jgi:hypothetical protein
MPEAGPVQQHLALLAPGQVGKALRAAGAFEGEQAVAVNPGNPANAALRSSPRMLVTG